MNIILATGDRGCPPRARELPWGPHRETPPPAIVSNMHSIKLNCRE